MTSLFQFGLCVACCKCPARSGQSTCQKCCEQQAVGFYVSNGIPQRPDWAQDDDEWNRVLDMDAEDRREAELLPASHYDDGSMGE